MIALWLARQHRRVSRGVAAARAVMVACVLGIAFAPAPAEAQLTSCTLGMPTVNFGSYNPLSATAVDVSGTVSFSCSLLALLPQLTLSRGSSSTFNPRTMQRTSPVGGGVLNYNVYLDAAHAFIWGDGTAGTQVFVALGLIGQVTFFGSVPARQNAPAGTYGDSPVVTIIF